MTPPLTHRCRMDMRHLRRGPQVPPGQPKRQRVPVGLQVPGGRSPGEMGHLFEAGEPRAQGQLGLVSGGAMKAPVSAKQHPTRMSMVRCTVFMVAPYDARGGRRISRPAPSPLSSGLGDGGMARPNR